MIMSVSKEITSLSKYNFISCRVAHVVECSRTLTPTTALAKRGGATYLQDSGGTDGRIARSLSYPIRSHLRAGMGCYSILARQDAYGPLSRFSLKYLKCLFNRSVYDRLTGVSLIFNGFSCQRTYS